MIVRKKIMVTGANGQLGKSLRKLSAHFPQFEFIFLAKEDLPVTHFEMIRQYFKVHAPHYLINAAAYTAVDRAESERDLAYQVNAEAVGVMAAICRENNCGFITISSDYVFDGRSALPYKENDRTNPLNEYGASKLEGEIQALQLNPASLIIRTSWVYSEYGKNFVRTMVKLMKEKESVRVVKDQFGSPTYATDLAKAILDIISSQKWEPGIFHYCNEGLISWFDLAVAIKELVNSSCRVDAISSQEFPTAANRPSYSALDSAKFKSTFGIEIREWKEGLKDCIDLIYNSS